MDVITETLIGLGSLLLAAWLSMAMRAMRASDRDDADYERRRRLLSE